MRFSGAILWLIMGLGQVHETQQRESNVFTSALVDINDMTDPLERTCSRTSHQPSRLLALETQLRQMKS